MIILKTDFGKLFIVPNNQENIIDQDAHFCFAVFRLKIKSAFYQFFIRFLVFKGHRLILIGRGRGGGILFCLLAGFPSFCDFFLEVKGGGGVLNSAVATLCQGKLKMIISLYNSKIFI